MGVVYVDVVYVYGVAYVVAGVFDIVDVVDTARCVVNVGMQCYVCVVWCCYCRVCLW